MRSIPQPLVVVIIRVMAIADQPSCEAA